MTEDEAKARWCPFARLKSANQGADGVPISQEPQTTFNRISINGEPRPFIPDQGRCIGSACMAWRWVKAPFTPAGGDPLATRRPLKDTDRGYCGLAGAPQ